MTTSSDDFTLSAPFETVVFLLRFMAHARPHSALGGLAPEEFARAMNEENLNGQRPNLRVVYSAG
jgi:hypothetical protein